MSEPTRDEKIRFIQEEVGVAPRDYAATKKKFDRLTDGDLDEKYRRSVRRSKHINELRKKGWRA